MSTSAPGLCVVGVTPARSRIGTFCALAGLLSILVGCGGEEKHPLSASPAPMATHRAFATPAHPTPAPSPTLGTVIWTTEVDPTTGAPADSVTVYAPDASQLIAAIPASALPAGATIDAAWLYNGTSLDAFNTRVSLPNSTAKRWVDLRLSRQVDSPWPDGTYEVIVSLNGAQIQRASVVVTNHN